MGESEYINPMSYDVMKEIANFIDGAYIHWSANAATKREADYWDKKSIDFMDEVMLVDPSDKRAVQAKVDELAKIWKSLPRQAPKIDSL
ncbi:MULTISPECIES: hypothetical protein [unclassified Winkia]|uniref:hypothetical protein n=1 Tax=unclassified Winkia TaxID=2692119 RepID=UPI002556825A|nr:MULTISPECIES: hypothetical protein [unclassified Winkia]MDK7163007.1 hypothetical protein [Winkia sp. UMB3105]MDK8594614.1 hypothetical protein [Winkia sp. UMB1096A]